MDILNKKGIVKIGAGAGFIIAIAVLLLFSSSLLTQIAAPTDLSGNMIDSIGGNQGTSTNKPVLIDFTRLGGDGEGDDETGESEGGDESDDEDEEPFFITGGGFPTGGGGGGPVVQCPPPTHKVCDYENEQCIVVQGPGEDECTTDEDCYCDPKTPGYWKNHLSEAEGLLDCVHDNYDVFDDVQNQSDITYVLECSGNCSNMFNKLNKFLLATILNICADYFDLDDAYNGSTIEYWIDNSVAEVENGESGMDEYYKDALDAILNGELECNPEWHTECNYQALACDTIQSPGTSECQAFDDCPQHKICDDEQCVIVEGEEADECETDDDCVEECIPPYLGVDKTAEPTDVICEEVTITLEVSGEGEICDGFYPVDVVLVFDNSGSMDDDGWDDNISDWQPIGDAKIAAEAFVDLLGSNDKAGLVSFNTVATLEHGLTFDKNAVKASIDGMSAGGWTNMSQAIDYANQELVNNGRVDVPWVEVLLSDGNNNCGSSSPPADCQQRVYDSSQEATDNDIVIYTIALGNNSNQTLMQDIADLTGGKFYYAPDSGDLQEIYEEIAEEVTDTAATNVTVIDYLPVYAELNESSLPSECVYDNVTRKITCEVGTIDINETVSFQFRIYPHQLGYILTNLYPDSGVEYLNYNETTVFEEFPETYVTVYGCEHTVCNYIDMTCDIIIEPEPGEDECETFQDCPQHTECDYVQQECAIVEGAGKDECDTYDDCFHDICDYQYLTCESRPISEPGDSCETDDDCYHLECIDIECLPVAGECSDQCSVDEDCYYYECDYQNQACSPTPGFEPDECSLYADCIHTECNYVDLTCNTILSQGISECVTFDDCAKHTECNYNLQQCLTVEGEGINQCSTYADCVHTECCGMTCITVNSAGTNECSTDADCIDHVCNYDTYTCDTVAGTGYVECQTFQDCPQHTVCDYQLDQCVTVEGAGENQCLNWGDCIHTECNYVDLTCDTIESQGIDECQTFQDCPQHKICDYQLEQCRTVEGAGTNECLVWEDCEFCGNERIDPGEDCEPPFDDNNPYCDQSTTECSGHKLGTRDAFGYCDGSCGCIDDPFTYSCVEGECGAECDEDTDCPCPKDGCVGPDWYDYPAHGECTEDCMCDVDETPCEGPCKPNITRDDPRCTRYVCDYQDKVCVLVEGDGPDECFDYSDCIHTECNYQAYTCDTINAPGISECVTFDDCDQHTVCDYVEKSCVIVEGTGTNECSTYSDCVHTECCGMTCITVNSAGTNECSTDADCIDHVCNYDTYTCDTVAGTGYVECSTFEDCPQHTVCDYIEQSCATVEGVGIDECITYDDCFHTECADGYCINVEGIGADLCESDYECRHFECNYVDFICEEIFDIGTSECQTFEDCPQHTECDYCLDQCITVEGTGIDECVTYDDCIHTECNYVDLTCDTIESPGTSECVTFDDCEKHTECDYQAEQCRIVEGAGIDECITYDDCFHDICDYQYLICESRPISEPGDSCETNEDCYHLECIGLECLPVAGDCSDQCSVDEDCYYYECDYQSQACSPTPGFEPDECSSYDDCTHTECNYVDLTCDTVLSQGISECVTFQDCPQHTVCDYIEQSCATVEGTGIDECVTYDDCFHNICSDMACITDPSPGIDECSTDADCYYYGCNYDFDACMQMPGTGLDECSAYFDDCAHRFCNYISFTCDVAEYPGTSECVTFEDCPQHRICDYGLEQCRIVEGPGIDECLVWEDCLMCGDGEVTPPEECELPGTSNNPYCSCPKDGCKGVNYYNYPNYASCLEDCMCGVCEPTESICDPRCMGDCEVEVKTGHDMNPNWPDGPPYTATNDIWIMATDVSNGACDGLKITIRYWWCSCPGKDPEQSAIEYDDPPKYDRLCSANAAGGDNPTHSLECSPCNIKNYHAQFPQDSGKKFWTGVGSSTGTFQIDVREYHDCYERKYPVALACAAKSEDQPTQTETHLECSNKQCVEVSGSGANQCGADCDCYYYACDTQQACVKKTGTQADKCSVDSDCVPEYHKECVDFICKPVSGPGPDECYNNLDCGYDKPDPPPM